MLYLHSTTNCAARFVNESRRIDSNSILLAFLPIGLNWGLLNVLRALFAGRTIVFQEVFDAEEALALIGRERITHFCCAPAHLVSLLNTPNLGSYDLPSLGEPGGDLRFRLPRAGGPDWLVIAERDGRAGPAGWGLGQAHGWPEMA